MVDLLEKIGSRLAGKTFSVPDKQTTKLKHPFEVRNIHQDIFKVSKQLFDDGHYRQATFDAYIHIEKQVKTKSKLRKTGLALMMDAFDEEKPKITLDVFVKDDEKNEQKGYRFIFAGAMAAIRNPRAHALGTETMDDCLDHLSIASALMRKLDRALK